jgi:hypothetical protein
MIDMIEMLGESGRDFQTAIVLTYRLDLELYDGLIRRVLNKVGVSSQVIFCDLGTYLEEIRLPHSARFLGRHYSVTPVHQAGAFHPKVYLLLGAKGGRALLGSGNTTVGGLVRNAEVFGQFEFNRELDSTPHPVFKQLAEFVRQLAERAPAAAQRQVHQALFSAGWLDLPTARDGRRLLISGPGRKPLIEQLLEHLPSKTIDEVVVCSSSFDRKLQGLRRLAGKTKKPPLCIVQPDRVDLDGAEIKRLGSQVAWRSFVDPYPKEKRKRRDVYAHAKILVLRHGHTETVVFGSCNVSEPALMGPNTETAIVLPPAERGRIAKKLGLDLSIKGASVFETVAAKRWPDDELAEDIVTMPCILVGLSASDVGFHLALISGEPPARSELAMATQSYGTPIAKLRIRKEDQGWISDRFELTDSVRFGWLVTSKGVPLSNPVAITWPEVCHARRGTSLNAKVASGLIAMYDGYVVGTILFELLDAFRDFEVIGVGVGKAHPAPAKDRELPAEQKPAEFFYTDERPSEVEAHHWQGDRLDLEILASLIQPLSQAPRATIDDDEEFDESKLGEEAERRQIDAQKGKATGSERDDVPRLTGEKLEKAVARLERRLRRAADSIEQSLEFLDKIKTVPTQAVARQIWMAQIGAFLSGRVVTSDDGDEFECLDPTALAEYVIRVARALVGSHRGGFLDRLPGGLWETHDGEMVKRGLGFLRTCVVWATARLIDEYTDSDPAEEWPESLACSIPELVAARFIHKLQLLGIACDEHELKRRFPVWMEMGPKKIAEVRSRLDSLADVIAAAEDRPATAQVPAYFPSLRPGTLVYSENLGVTALMYESTPPQFWLADFSRPGDTPAKYGARVSPLVVNGAAPMIYCWFRSTSE